MIQEWCEGACVLVTAQKSGRLGLGLESKQGEGEGAQKREGIWKTKKQEEGKKGTMRGRKKRMRS